MTQAQTSPVAMADVLGQMKKRAPKRYAKMVDKMVEQAYYAACSGIQINIMDIGKVFTHGRALVEQGADEAALRSGVRAFVDTIRKN